MSRATDQINKATIRIDMSSWYLASPNASTSLQTIFEESLARFKEKLSSQSTKRARLATLKITRLQDVVEEVAKAQTTYDKKKGDSRLSRYIVSFSQRIVYYGKVLDVMVQHHPEYVSLAWGSLKLVFGAVLEHERLGSTIVAALSDIGEALSRVDLAESLYPTERMRATLVTLNCHIITFLCRALDWYESSTLSRAIQSVARPAALRYDDLIKEINKTLAQVTGLSAAGAQAEQRDMHEGMRLEHDAQKGFRTVVQSRLDEMQHQLNALVRQRQSEGDLKTIHQELQSLKTLVREISRAQSYSEKTVLQELVVIKQDIHTTQTTLSQQLSDVQIQQALSIFSRYCKIDHKVAFQNASLLRKVRRTSTIKCAPFWNSPQLHLWDHSPSHSSVILSSTFRDRLSVRDFYVGAIEQLRQSNIPVLWTIEQKDQRHDVFEMLKSLISQAISIISSIHTHVLLTTHLRAFNSALCVEDYTILLAEIMSHLDLLYIIVDVNAISSELIEDCRTSLFKVSQSLSEHAQATKLKVMIVGHGLSRGAFQDKEEMVIRVMPTSKRKSKKVPKAPLKGRIRSVAVR